MRQIKHGIQHLPLITIIVVISNSQTVTPKTSPASVVISHSRFIY